MAKQGARSPMYRLAASSTPVGQSLPSMGSKDINIDASAVYSCRSSRSLRSRRCCHRYIVALVAPTTQHSTAMSHERQQPKLPISYTDCRPLSSGFQEFLDAFGAPEGVRRCSREEVKSRASHPCRIKSRASHSFRIKTESSS